mmetsp:Transcript_3622/g.4457  ORF Transcript_3622/g.4457 Transcript_3622/m.4457 type:complete len:86 (-) Transcript_3622:1073-1330(-)
MSYDDRVEGKILFEQFCLAEPNIVYRDKSSKIPYKHVKGHGSCTTTCLSKSTSAPFSSSIFNPHSPPHPLRQYQSQHQMHQIKYP